MAHNAKVQPALFIAGILCFLFPFITVSCNGQKVASFTGVQLAVGTTLDEPQLFGPPKKRNVDAEPLAALAGLCALAGLGFAFSRSRAIIAAGVCGAGAAVFMLLLKSRLDSDIARAGQGMLHPEYEAGYTISLLSLIAGAAWSFYMFSQSKKGLAPAPPSLNAVSPASGPSPPAVCPNCKTMMLSNGVKFCHACGQSVA